MAPFTQGTFYTPALHLPPSKALKSLKLSHSFMHCPIFQTPSFIYFTYRKSLYSFHGRFFRNGAIFSCRDRNCHCVYIYRLLLPIKLIIYQLHLIIELTILFFFFVFSVDFSILSTTSLKYSTISYLNCLGTIYLSALQLRMLDSVCMLKLITILHSYVYDLSLEITI